TEWVAAKTSTPGWEKIEFDDSSWSKAKVVGRHGDGPWGKLDQPDTDSAYGPQSTGIADVVRLIYVPENQTVVVRKLTAGRKYSAAVFDPVTGSRTSLGAVQADSAGAWRCPPPPG